MLGITRVREEGKQVIRTKHTSYRDHTLLVRQATEREKRENNWRKEKIKERITRERWNTRENREREKVSQFECLLS